MQRNWIGRSIGADVDFEIEGRDERRRRSSRPAPTRSTARPSWSSRPTPTSPPSSPPAPTPRCSSAFADYLEQVQQRDRDRPADAPTGRRPASSCERYAINPVNGERLPIWAADYVLADYGHGADHGRAGARPARPRLRPRVRPAGARRGRHERARHRRDPGDRLDETACRSCRRPAALDPASTGVALTGDGRLINSGPLDGLCKSNAIRRIIEHARAARARAAPRRTTACATG